MKLSGQSTLSPGEKRHRICFKKIENWVECREPLESQIFPPHYMQIGDYPLYTQTREKMFVFLEQLKEI